MTTDTNSPYAIQLEQQRDLRSQIAELGAESPAEWSFTEWSPGRKYVSLWSMQDGTEIRIPQYMVGAAISKRLPDGSGYLFTAVKESAPVYREPPLPCFLGPDSEERLSGDLEAAGLSSVPPCKTRLGSHMSQVTHGSHIHPTSWAIYQDYLAEREKRQDREAQQKQLDAMLALAKASQAK